jgi:predicted  nucleic acid-binding Zn-ribbon protein
MNFMDIKEILSQVTAKAGDSASQIEPLLQKIEKAFQSLEADKERFESEVTDAEKAKAKAESEAISRKKAIAKLEARIETIESENAEALKKLEGSESHSDYEEIKKQNAQYKEQFTAILAERKKTLQTEFEKLSKHPRWDKAKSLFALPAEKDGKTNWEKWADEDVQKSFEKLNELRAIDYFEGEQSFQRAESSMRNTQNGDIDFSKIKSKDQVFGAVMNELNR